MVQPRAYYNVSREGLESDLTVKSMVSHREVKSAARRRRRLSRLERDSLDMKLESAVRGKKTLKQRLLSTDSDWLSEKVASFDDIKSFLEMGASPNFIITHHMAESTNILDIERRNANGDEGVDLLKSYGALITTKKKSATK